jgi:sulfite reductase (ferredoxin)
VGFDALREFAATYAPAKRGRTKDNRKRVTVRDDLFDRVQKISTGRQQSITDFVNDLIRNHLQTVDQNGVANDHQPPM